jgi:hypothetical protein
MAQQFIVLPLPVSGDGPGAAVAIPAASPHKTVAVTGAWAGMRGVALEVSADGIKWATAAFFDEPRQAPRTLTLSAPFARARVYRGLGLGTPVLTLGIDTVTGSYQQAQLPLDGTPVDVSLFENKHKTVIVSGVTDDNLDGQVVVYASADGVKYVAVFVARGSDTPLYLLDGFVKFMRAFPATPPLVAAAGNTAGMQVDVCTEPFECGASPPITFRTSPYSLDHDQQSPPIIIPTGVESIIGHETHCVVDWDALPGTEIRVAVTAYNQGGATFRAYIGGTPPPGFPNTIVGTLAVTGTPIGIFGDYTDAQGALVTKPTGRSFVVMTGDVASLSGTFTHAHVGLLPDPSEGLILPVDTEREVLAGTDRLVSWEVDFTRFASSNLLFALAGLSSVDTGEAGTVTVKVGGTYGVDDGVTVCSFPITTSVGTISGASATVARPVGLQPVKIIVTGHASARMLYDSLVITGAP